MGIFVLVYVGYNRDIFSCFGSIFGFFLSCIFGFIFLVGGVIGGWSIGLSFVYFYIRRSIIIRIVVLFFGGF